MSKEWDAADAACKKALGSGWCAVADENGNPTNPLHCAQAIMAKPGNIGVNIKKVGRLIVADPKVKVKTPPKK